MGRGISCNVAAPAEVSNRRRKKALWRIVGAVVTNPSHESGVVEAVD